MFKLHTVFVKLGDSMKSAMPAPDLADEMRDLTRHFREAFGKSPDRL